MSTFARKSFQSVPLMAVTCSFAVLSSCRIFGSMAFWSAVAALCSPK
ncbi:hypothetical protein [Curtobacterium sp. SORGH_AS_0776]|nr:hypothetical protein [Curtobacterium sp. SORGH_AS_0776]